MTVLFNMHDTDNDGTITLEEYKHVRHTISKYVQYYITLKWINKVIEVVTIKRLMFLN